MADSSLLTKLNTEEIYEFSHGLVDDICGKRGLDYQLWKSYFTLSEWIVVKSETKHMILKIAGNKVENQHEVSDAFISLQKIVKLRQKDLRLYLVKETSKISGCRLRDFDWKSKVVLASDKMATIRQPLLQLDLLLESQGKENVFSVELNHSELEQMVQSLEAANKAVLQLRVS